MRHIHLKAYIYTLKLPKCTADFITQILEDIYSLNTNELSLYKLDIAELFCRAMMVSSNLKFMEKIETYLIDKTFDHIKGLYNQYNETSSVYEVIMTFLFQLQLKRKVKEQIPEFELIADKLDDMSQIFLLKKDDKLLFPIGDLLNLVFKRNLTFKTIDKQTLNIFLLSMKIFKEQNIFEEKYKELIEKNNLKCLDYLSKNEYEPLGESSIWKENLVNNGSLVLINTLNHKIYIRSNTKEYFNNDANIDIEYNSFKEPIGYFYEDTLPQDVEFTSIEDIFKNGKTEEIFQLLEILYDENKYNTFLDKSLYKIHGKLYCTNKFVINDKSIIYISNTNDIKNEVIASRKELTTLLKQYNFVKLFENEECKFDCLLAGVLFDILNYFPEQNFKELSEFIKSINKNFQFEILNYLLSKNSLDECLKFFAYYTDKTKYIKSGPSIVSEKITELIYLPYEFPKNFIAKQMENLFNEPCNENNFIKPEITLNLNNEIQKIFYEGREIEHEILDIVDNIQESTGLLLNNKVYFSKDINMYADFCTRIDSINNYLLNWTSFMALPKDQVTNIIKTMRLQHDAISYLGKQYLEPEFETIAYLRLLHHCACFNLTEIENWNKFYSIIINHNILTFKYLYGHELNLKEGILYIPKDKEENDATLKSICDNYLFNSSGERTRTIYYNMVGINNGKYTSRNEEIKEIVFLFDNIIDGSSTIRCLNAYLSINAPLIKDYKNIQYYFCGDRKVDLIDILKTNNIKFKIRAFWATETGLKNVKDFIEKYCNEFFDNNGIAVDNNIELRTTQEFKQNVSDIYSKVFNDDDYPVLREFNLPSVTVFPEPVIQQNSIAAIFVRKDEVYKLKT